MQQFIKVGDLIVLALHRIESIRILPFRQAIEYKMISGGTTREYFANDELYNEKRKWVESLPVTTKDTSSSTKNK